MDNIKDKTVTTESGLDISPRVFESILRTLPVSLYAGRDIDVSIDYSGNTTYYNLLEDSITISYNSMANCLLNFKKIEDFESTIRGLLYHEISHALLTSMELAQNCDQLTHDIYNVFEDERIETIFKDLYYGVDFKRNIILITDWHGEEPTNAFDDFYHIVRFRTGKEDYVKRTAEIISKYDHLTSEDDYKYDWNDYKAEVYDFWLDVAKDWYEENDPDKIKSKDPSYDSKDDSGKKETIKKILESESESEMTEGHPDTKKKMIIVDKLPEGKAGTPGEGDPNTIVVVKNPDPPKDDDAISDEDLKKLLEDIDEIIDMTDPNKTRDPQKILETRLNHYVDNDLTEKMAEIFNNFLSRNKNNGSAQRRYSGALDPRAVGRDDWRIWTYKSTTGPIKGYDKLHVNLFIDTSGSFRSNDEKVNTILKSLDILEDRYPFFDFDLVTMQCGETLRDKNQRYIQSYGGNDLDNDIHGIFDKLNPGNRLNYNIILFDGDAFTDAYGKNHQHNFSAFNSSRCSIISDDDNESYIRKYAPLANSTFVDGSRSRQSYSSMLYDNILNALNRALL